MNKKALLLAVGLGLGVLGMSSLPGLLRGCKSDTKPVKQPGVDNTSYIEFTRLTHYNKGDGAADVVFHRVDSPLTNMRVMTDGGKHGVNDGLVDMVAISDPESYLSREQDSDKHKEEFDRADKLLAEIKRRAKEFGVNNTGYAEFTSYTRHSNDDGVADVVFHRIDLPLAGIRVISDGGKDGVNDGLVDFIAISDPESYLSREQDSDKHKEEFDRADKLLAEIKRRAKESGYPPEAQKIKGFHNAIENSFYLDGWVWDESLKDYVPRKE